jgi:uncharacterized protein (DUF983 family)
MKKDRTARFYTTVAAVYLVVAVGFLIEAVVSISFDTMTKASDWVSVVLGLAVTVFAAILTVMYFRGATATRRTG